MKKRIAKFLAFLLIFSSLATNIPALEVQAADQAESIVSVARSQIGVKERSSNSDDILYNDWYYGRRVNNNGVAAKYAWCAVFVSWCADQAGIPTNIIPKTANTTDMKNRLINSGGSSHLKGSGYMPRSGDIIFFGSNASQHVGIVKSSSGSTVYYIDGNNTQTNPHGVHDSSCSLSAGNLWGFVTPNYSSPTLSSKPTNPTVSKNQVWYDIKDRIELKVHADGATSYFMSIFKDGEKIVSQGVDGTYTFDASTYGYGQYSAYFSCTNNVGTIDTEWIDFSVVGAATYTNVYASSWWYDLTDTVNISVDTVCAKGQVIGIDKEGAGRVITQNTENTYTIAASELGVGMYSAYFSVYNGSGGIDTERVSFEIVDAPKEGAALSTTKTSYTLNDTVQVSVLVDCSKGQVIGIDDTIRNKRVITEEADNGIYAIPASKLGRGKYSAYFSVYNGSGGYDTSRIEFAIDNQLTNPEIAIDKNSYGTNEDIIVSASANGGVEFYTLKVCDASGTEVVKKDFTGHHITVNANELGEGAYTAKVTCANYAFESDTRTVSFSIGNQVIPEEPDKSDSDQSTGDKEDTSDSKPEEKEDTPSSPSDDKDTIQPEKSGETNDSDSDFNDADDMEEGDIFQDDSGDGEYEVISVKGTAVCVEYTDCANPKATVIRIPAEIEAEDGTICKVTSIANSAFRKNKKIKKVFVGNNVETIGANAFYGCKNLTNVSLGKNLTSIGANAFSGCVKLKSLIIPAKVKKVGSNAFYGCKALKRLTIKTTKLTSKGLGKKAWKGIPAKAAVRVPAGKQKAYKKLFYKKGLNRKIRIK